MKRSKSNTVRMQLAKNNEEDPRIGDYVLGVRLRKHADDDWIWFDGVRCPAYEIDANHITRYFPHLRLKPGEGPIEVDVTIEKVKR